LHHEYWTEWDEQKQGNLTLNKIVQNNRLRAGGEALELEYKQSNDPNILGKAITLLNLADEKEAAMKVKSGEICSAILDEMSPTARTLFCAQNKLQVEAILRDSRDIIELRKLMDSTCRDPSNSNEANLARYEDELWKMHQGEEESYPAFIARIRKKTALIASTAAKINPALKDDFDKRPTNLQRIINLCNIQAMRYKRGMIEGKFVHDGVEDLLTKLLAWSAENLEMAHRLGYTKIDEVYHAMWREHEVQKARNMHRKPEIAAAAEDFEASYRQGSHKHQKQHQGRAPQKQHANQAYAAQMKNHAPVKTSAVKPDMKLKGKGQISRLENLELEPKYNNIANSCHYHLQKQKQGLFNQGIMHTAKDCRAIKAVGKNLQQGGAPHRKIGNGAPAQRARQTAPTQSVFGGAARNRSRSAPTFFLGEEEEALGVQEVEPQKREVIYIPPEPVEGASPEDFAVEDRRARIEFFVEGPSRRYQVSAPSTLLGEVLLQWIPGADVGRLTHRGFKHVDPGVSLGAQGIRADTILNLSFLGLGGGNNDDENEETDIEIEEIIEASRRRPEERSEMERIRMERLEAMPQRDEAQALAAGIEALRAAQTTAATSPPVSTGTIVRTEQEVRNHIEYARPGFLINYGVGLSNTHRRADVAGSMCREIGVTPAVALGIAEEYCIHHQDHRNSITLAFFTGYATATYLGLEAVIDLRLKVLNDMIKNPDKYDDESMSRFSDARRIREEYEADLVSTRQGVYRDRHPIQAVEALEQFVAIRAIRLRSELISRARNDRNKMKAEANEACKKAEAEIFEQKRRRDARELELQEIEKRFEPRRRSNISQDEEVVVQEGVTTDGRQVSTVVSRVQSLQAGNDGDTEHGRIYREHAEAIMVRLEGDVLQNYLSNLSYREHPSNDFVSRATPNIPQSAFIRGLF